MAKIIREPRAIEAAYLRKIRGIWKRSQQIIAYGLEPLLYIWPSEGDASDDRFPKSDSVRLDAPAHPPRTPPRYNPLTAPMVRRRASDMSDSELRRIWPGIDPADIRAYAPWATSRSEVERIASYGGQRLTGEQLDRHRRGLPVSLSQDQLEGYIRDAISAEMARVPQWSGPSHFGDPSLVRPKGALRLRSPMIPVLLGEDGLPLPLPPRPGVVDEAAIARQIEWIEVTLKDVTAEGYIVEIIGATGERTSSFVSSQLNRVLDLSLKLSDPTLQAMIDTWRDRNVSLIRDGLLGPKPDGGRRGGLLGDLSKTINDSHTDGLRVERLAFDIRARFGVSDSKAELIARDQILKLNGQINRQRQMELGITKYRWSTSKDSRVRKSHARLDGTIQDWSAPPSVGGGRHEHPGGDYQCRCIATPIMPGEEQVAMARAQK